MSKKNGNSSKKGGWLSRLFHGGGNQLADELLGSEKDRAAASPKSLCPSKPSGRCAC